MLAVDNKDGLDGLAIVLAGYLGSDRVVVIHSSMDPREKAANVEKAKSTPGMCILGTILSMSTGINFQEFLGMIVTLAPGYVLEEMKQLLARMHRLGQTGFGLLLCLVSGNCEQRATSLTKDKLANTAAYYEKNAAEDFGSCSTKSQVRMINEKRFEDMNHVKIADVPGVLYGLCELGRRGLFVPGECWQLWHSLSGIKQSVTEVAILRALRVLEPKLSGAAATRSLQKQRVSVTLATEAPAGEMEITPATAEPESAAAAAPESDMDTEL